MARRRRYKPRIVRMPVGEPKAGLTHIGIPTFAFYQNAVVHLVSLGSTLGSILLQVGGVVVVLAPEDSVAAAAAYRVEVPVLGVVGLFAEAGVGVLAAGAAIAAPTAGSTSAEVERKAAPGAGLPGAASGWMGKAPGSL